MILRFFFLFILLFPFTASSQKLYRLKASFEIREKTFSDSTHFIKGTVLFDKFYNQVIYNISQPNEEKWVIRDTIFSIYQNDTLISKGNLFFLNGFSLFSLILNGKLNTYGLENTGFKLSKTDLTDTGTVQYWNSPENPIFNRGSIILVTAFNKLVSVAILNSKGDIIQKQYFSDYKKYNKLDIPCELIEITFRNNTKQYRITKFNEIIIDEKGSDHLYHTD